MMDYLLMYKALYSIVVTNINPLQVQVKVNVVPHAVLMFDVMVKSLQYNKPYTHLQWTL